MAVLAHHFPSSVLFAPFALFAVQSFQSRSKPPTREARGRGSLMAQAARLGGDSSSASACGQRGA